VQEVNEATEPSVYLRISANVASAMAIPVKIGGQVEWIVEITSTDRNAFEGPDLDDVKELMEEWQEALNERWQGHQKEALLAAADQALRVVDKIGPIRL